MSSCLCIPIVEEDAVHVNPGCPVHGQRAERERVERGPERRHVLGHRKDCQGPLPYCNTCCERKGTDRRVPQRTEGAPLGWVWLRRSLITDHSTIVAGAVYKSEADALAAIGTFKGSPHCAYTVEPVGARVPVTESGDTRPADVIQQERDVVSAAYDAGFSMGLRMGAAKSGEAIGEEGANALIRVMDALKKAQSDLATERGVNALLKESRAARVTESEVEPVGYDWKIERDEHGIWLTHVRWSLVGRGDTLAEAAAEIDQEAPSVYAAYRRHPDDELSDEAKAMLKWLEDIISPSSPPARERRAMAKEMGEVEAVALLERLRWGHNPSCAKCGAHDVYQMRDRNGCRERSFRWRCRMCNGQYTVRLGTVLEDSRVPLATWVYAYQLATTEGLTALALEVDTGLSYKSALRLMRKIQMVARTPEAEPHE